MSATVFICGPSTSNRRRRIKWCPVEERRRRMVVSYGGYWGVDVRCCGCGDMWMDGELAPRPFAPKWREKAIAQFKQMWQEAPSGPPPGFCDEFGHDPDMPHMCDCNRTERT